MENNLTNEQGGNLKKCPLCAETIPLEAVTCEFCGARFDVTGSGYCENCHQVREADGNGKCRVCGNDILDWHIKSKLIQSAARPAQPPPPPIRPAQLKPPPKKRFAWVWILGILILLAGVCIVGGIILSTNPIVDTVPTPTRPTPITPSTPKPPTPIPTLTSTPQPMTVTFDTIGSYPEGRLVILSGILEMFKSTWCDSECGLILAEYSNSPNSITIFVRVATEGVEPSPNQMKALPDPFSKWDVVICLNDGALAYIDNRITVTGRICKTTAGTPCISDITKIELEK